MLVNQVRRFGETLVDRHVLSRDDLEHAIEEAERTKQPLPSVLLRLGLVGTQGPHRRARRPARRAVHRLPRDADPPGRARRCSPPSSRGSTRAAGRLRGPQARRRVRGAGRRRRGRRGRRTRPRYEIIAAVADRAELMRAIDMIYGRRPTGDAPSSARTSSSATTSRRRAAHQRPARRSSSSGAVPTCTSPSGSPPVVRVQRRPAPDHRAAGAQRLADPPDGVSRSSPRSSGRSSRTSSSSTRRTRCRARAASASTCSCSATPSAA